jgi:RimJ/RimL family protein N-acetyltransferase
MLAALGAARSMGLTRVELTVRERNVNAIALYENLGFRHEGRRLNAVRVDGSYENLLGMAILFDDPV